jgi:diketogulonate reductase-like aldo/keto reductase
VDIPSKQTAHVSIPAFGLGTWGMGGKMERDPANDDERDVSMLRQALASGVTHIDTAESYAAGHAETLVGQAMEGNPRNDLFVASKVYGTNLSHDGVVKACEASLKRLGTSYLDLYYIHYRNPDFPLEETARALNTLRRDGLIRNVGVCNFTVQSMKDLQLHLEMPIVANQSHYNLVYREPEKAGVLDHCQSVGALFIAWRPIAWHDAKRGNPTAGNAWDTGVYPILDEVARRYGRTNLQVAINWLIGQPNVCTLVKASQPQHLQEILGAVEWRLSDDDIELLRRDFPDQRDVSPVVPLG